MYAVHSYFIKKVCRITLVDLPHFIQHRVGRFLEKGGLKILCAWLVTAAADEQTSVLRQLLLVIIETFNFILMWSMNLQGVYQSSICCSEWPEIKDFSLTCK